MNVNSEPDKAHNSLFISKEEDFEQMIEGRYRTGSTYVNERFVDGIVLDPSAIRDREFSVSTWDPVKSGNYNVDLGHVVAVNKNTKTTVKQIPRIDVQAMTAQFGRGDTRKKQPSPALRWISTSELEEFIPYILDRKDKNTGLSFLCLVGMLPMLGYMDRKLQLDSLYCWCFVLLEEDIPKFKHSENNKSADLECLSQLYGDSKSRKSIDNDEGKGSAGCNGKGDSSNVNGKGEGPSGWKEGSSGNGEGFLGRGVNLYELYDLVCFCKNDFGFVLGADKDDTYTILNEIFGGFSVVTILQNEIMHMLSDVKCTAFDQRQKNICNNDTIIVLERPLKDKQRIVKQLYLSKVFIFDENEITQDGGYFGSISQLCEKIKQSIVISAEKDGDPGALLYEDFTLSPNSPLLPKHLWQGRENNQGETDGMFSIDQTLRISVGPIKRYLCRVFAIHLSDITVNLESQQRVLTVKAEHLTEVRAKSSDFLSEDPESSFVKPFYLLGDGSSQDWTDEAGRLAGGEGWNAGGSSGERNDWISFSFKGNSHVFIPLQPVFSSVNPFHLDGNGAYKEYSWETNVALNNNQSWGVAVTENRVQDSIWVGKVGSDITSSDSWQEASEPTNLSWGIAAAVDSNSHGTGWGTKAGCDLPLSDSWKIASEAASNSSRGVAATACNNDHGFVWVGNDSQKPSVADRDDIGSAWNEPIEGSWTKKTGGSSWVKQADCSIKGGSSTGDVGWKSSRPSVDNQTAGSWVDAGGWEEAQGDEGTHRESTETNCFYGTTTAAVIGNYSAIVVVEGRGMSVNEKGLISSGNEKKVSRIGPSILALGAGYSPVCYQMTAAAQKVEGVEKIFEVLDNYILEWKRNNKEKRFPTQVTLVWSTDSDLAIRVFDGLKDNEIVREKNVLVSTGTGSQYVQEHMNECFKNKKLNVEDDYVNCLLSALVYACTRSKSSGGIIRSGWVRKGKQAEDYTGHHVLASLSLCKDFVRGYLKSSIFCTSAVLDYNLNSEINLEGQVSEKLGSPQQIQVLGVKKKFMVRLLRFSSIESMEAALTCLRDFSNTYEFSRVTEDEITRISMQFEDITVRSTDFL